MTAPLDVRAPHPGEWVRVNPDPTARKEEMLFREDDGELFLVAENMIEEMRRLAPKRLEPTMLFVACNREGNYFLWPVRAPVPEQHLAFKAMTGWVCFPVLH